MTRPSTTKSPVTPPATAAAAIWGATFPIPAGPGTGDDFEARVEAAWRHLKAAYSAGEEYGRLRELLATRIEAESVAGSQPNNQCLNQRAVQRSPRNRTKYQPITSQDPNRGLFTK